MWLGRLTHEHYPVLCRTTDRVILAHRYSYERFVGPLDPKLVLDHLCRNRWCVNPSHLEQVTNTENVLRGMSPPAIAARRSTCAAGHPYTTDNTYLRRRGQRECRECTRARERVLWPQKAARLKARLAGTPTPAVPQ
jgi:hypothetical protein